MMASWAGGAAELTIGCSPNEQAVPNRGINVLADNARSAHDGGDETLRRRRAPPRGPLRISRRPGARPLRSAGDVRPGDQAPARRRAYPSGLLDHGGRDRSGAAGGLVRFSIPPRRHLPRSARRRRHADRGGPGRRGGAGGRTGDGHLPAQARRSEPVQRAAAAAGSRDALGARAGGLGRGASRDRSIGACARPARRQERATSDARLPQGAGDRSRGGDRAAPPGSGPSRAAAVRLRPRRSCGAGRVRQRSGVAGAFPPRPPRDALRLPRALLGGQGARLVRRRIHPAFVVAGAVFVVLLCAAAVRATPSILIVPLEREFGWSRALLSSAGSGNLVLYGLVGPFAAALMERFGIRPTVLASLALICAGAAP